MGLHQKYTQWPNYAKSTLSTLNYKKVHSVHQIYAKVYSVYEATPKYTQYTKYIPKVIYSATIAAIGHISEAKEVGQGLWADATQRKDLHAHMYAMALINKDIVASSSGYCQNTTTMTHILYCCY